MYYYGQNYGYPGTQYGYGYPTTGGGGLGVFAVILVIFILLVVIGCNRCGGHDNCGGY
jgi:hypothetical protein